MLFPLVHRKTFGIFVLNILRRNNSVPSTNQKIQKKLCLFCFALSGMSKQSLLSGTVCDTLVQVSPSTKRRKSTWLGTRADFPTHRSDFKDFKMKQNLKAFLLSLLPFWKGNQERIGRQQKQSQPESDPMVRCIYLGTSGTGPSTFSLYKLLKEFEMHFSALWEQSMPNELSAPLECVTHKEFC